MLQREKMGEKEKVRISRGCSSGNLRCSTGDGKSRLMDDFMS
jgi:hypothetical protein